jgi:hypothetical protein
VVGVGSLAEVATENINIGDHAVNVDLIEVVRWLAKVTATPPALTNADLRPYL